jgi:hypothetical protein
MRGNAMTGREAGALARDDGEVPIAAVMIRMGGDGRSTTYRTESGELMCQVQAGLLCSEVPVMASLCGDDLGCNGRWSCLTKAADAMILISKPDPLFTSEA